MEKKIITLKEMLEQLCLSRNGYYKMAKEESPHYDKDLPKPVRNYAGGGRLVFMQKHVDEYEAILLQRMLEEDSDLAA